MVSKLCTVVVPGEYLCPNDFSGHVVKSEDPTAGLCSNVNCSISKDSLA